MSVDRRYGVHWLAKAPDMGVADRGAHVIASIDLRVEIPGVDTLTAEDALRLESGLRQIVERVLQDAKAGLL